MPPCFFSFGVEPVFPRVCKNVQAFNPDKPLLKVTLPVAFYFSFEVMFSVYSEGEI